MFNLPEFKEFVDIEEMDDYAAKNLTYLSEGSNRKVYQIGEDKVLKIAKNEIGCQANYTEVRLSNESKDSFFLPKKIDNHEMCFWTIFEKCDTITEEEFYKITSIKFNEFVEFLNKVNPENKKPNDKAKEILKFCEDKKILSVGLMEIDSWGKKGNNVVILDFGFCEHSFNKRKRRYISTDVRPFYSGIEF